LQKEPVTALIIGATKISHLEEAVGALSIKLTSEEMAFLEEPYVPHQVVGAL
jgi:1-deoxyxylulose-5-phosphate synthase